MAEGGAEGKTKAFFLESPTNPTLEVIDIAAVAEIAHEAGARLIVDNVFATPLLQKPLELGADIVVYSATKHIDGQGRCLGGVILADEKFIADHRAHLPAPDRPVAQPVQRLGAAEGAGDAGDPRRARRRRRRPSSPTCSPSIRKVTRVLYPGRADHPAGRARQAADDAAARRWSPSRSKGGQAGAFKVANALKIIRISNNLGDAKSLITHPSTTTHQRLSEEARLELGITQGMLRLSVGLEDPDDLAEDLDAALDAA